VPDPVGAQPGYRMSLAGHMASLAVPLMNRGFRVFCGVSALLNLFIALPMPLLVPYLSVTRGFPASLTIIAMGGMSVGAIISLIPWGKYADRRGSVALFVRACLPLAVLLVILILIPPYAGSPALSLLLAGLCFTGIGAGGAGFGIAYTGYLFHASPHDQSPTYMGLHLFAISLAGILGPLLGGTAAELLESVRLPVAGLTLGSYQIVFVACALLLASAMLLVRQLPAQQLTAADAHLKRP